MKTFAMLFKKYRLKAEFGTFTEFTDALAEKGYYYENSIFSHWQKGTRTPSPSNRQLMLTILEIFIARDSIKIPSEANEFLSSTGLGNLTDEEIQKIFKKNILQFSSLSKNSVFEQLNKLIFLALALLGAVLFSIYAFIDVQNTLVFFAFCFNFLISVLLYLQVAQKSAMIKYLNIFAFGSSAWCLATIFFRAAAPAESVLAAKLLYLAPIVTPTAFLLFGLFFPKEKVNKGILACLIGCTVLVSVLTLIKDAVIVDVIIPPIGEKILVFGWAYYSIYIFYYPLFFILGYFVFFKKYLMAKTQVKKQVLCLLVGMALGSLPGMITCLVFGTLGMFEYKWLGPACTIFWIAGVYLAIVKYHLLHRHPLFKKFFIDISSRINLGYSYRKKISSS